MSKDAWSGGGECAKQAAADRAEREQQAVAGLPALQRKADAGDLAAQISFANFHVYDYRHLPVANRALGLVYFDKAAKQGSLLAQQITVTEAMANCVKARYQDKRPPSEAGPQFAPDCTNQWQALEQLAKNVCITDRFIGGSYSLQGQVAGAYDNAGKADQADFWHMINLTYCVPPPDRKDLRFDGLFSPKSTSGTDELYAIRSEMHLQMRGRQGFTGIPQPAPEILAAVAARLTAVRAAVAASAIRPVLPPAVKK